MQCKKYCIGAVRGLGFCPTRSEHGRFGVRFPGLRLFLAPGFGPGRRSAVGQELPLTSDRWTAALTHIAAVGKIRGNDCNRPVPVTGGVVRE